MCGESRGDEGAGEELETPESAPEECGTRLGTIPYRGLGAVSTLAAGRSSLELLDED